ncbi:MAG: hypothetical protein JOY72_03215, partial [Actinobacteria bacterium]|nr:hypothetical protein [Actinomycetota bacterium]
MKNIQTLKLSASGAHAPVDRAPAPAQAEASTVEIERPVAAVAPARPRTGSWRKRVVTLFVVDAVATLAAIAASRTVHDTLVRYFIAGAALAAAL